MSSYTPAKIKESRFALLEEVNVNNQYCLLAHDASALEHFEMCKNDIYHRRLPEMIAHSNELTIIASLDTSDNW